MEKPTPPKVKIFIALPCYWDVDPFFAQSVMRLIHGSKIQYAIDWQIGDSLVGRARNTITARFLKSDCTHLLFIDSDLRFFPEHVEKIVSHNKPIVGGLYCKKQEGIPQLVLNTRNAPRAKKFWTPQKDGLLSVKYIGTGFMCIAREVFEKMAERWPEDYYVTDQTYESRKKVKEYDFWRVGVYQFKKLPPRYLSEDWWFCQRAIELGYKIYADMSVLVEHSGHALYPLKSQVPYLFPKKKKSSARVVGSSRRRNRSGVASVASESLTLTKG